MADLETMTCDSCECEYPLQEMRKRPPAKDGTPRYDRVCNPCNARRAREWYHDNRERADRNRWAWSLWNLYEITIEQYEQMLFDQGGACAICRGQQQGSRIKRLVVDHDHATGKIRGLLCNRCNRALGLLGDDPDILRKMLDYLLRGE